MTARSENAREAVARAAAAPENGYQRRRRETQRLLLAAGRELFLQRPVAEVSIEAITELAGVAKGSFYNHFASREALLETVLEQTVQAVLARHRAYDPPFADALTYALAKTRYAFHTLLSDRAACQLLLQGGQPSQGGAIDRVMRLMLGDRLAMGVSLGSLSHLDPELVYAAQFGVITETIAYLLTREEELDVDDAADQITELMFAAIGLPHRRPPRHSGESAEPPP